MSSITAALVQLTSSDDMRANIEAVTALVAEAAGRGATFIVTPETTHLMVTGREKALSRSFIQDEDPGLKAFCGLAAKHAVWLLIGSLIIRKTTDRLVNRSFLISPDGTIAAHYDKMHLFDVDLGGGEQYRESALFDAGSTPTLAKTPFGTIGMSICYDLRFPLLYTLLARAGASLITIPAAFTVPTGQAHWHTLVRARAIETGAYVLAPAQTGLHSTGRQTYGHSLIVDPWGTILVDAGSEPGVFMAELDLAKVAAVRQKMPSLGHARPLAEPKIWTGKHDRL